MKRIDTFEATFYIAASSNSEKEQWIGQIGNPIFTQAKAWSSSIIKARSDLLLLYNSLI